MQTLHVALVILACTLAGTLYAGSGETPSRPETAEQRLTEARTRLNLTDQQAEAMRPILSKNLQAAKSVLESYGIDMDDPQAQHDKLGFRKARQLGKEMDAIRAATLEDLAPILDEAQLAEYKQIQQENKAAMRERIRQGRDS